MTLGRILVNDTVRGTGFALAPEHGGASTVVLTARHIILAPGADPLLRPPSEIVFAAETGLKYQVESVDGNAVLDAAVLRLKKPVPEGLRVQNGARQETEWQTEARPHASLPMLTGTVTNPRLRIENARGQGTVAMQLWVKEGLEDFGGYSGSPVTLRSQADAVIGLVVEQVRSRLKVPLGEAKPATNVMYATPIREVLEGFGLGAAIADPPATLRPPDPPAHALHRDDRLQAIEEDLTGGSIDADGEPVPSRRRVALVGMGGAGKTVLAAQLARDPDLRGAFPDGVFWIGLERWGEQERESSLAARQSLLAKHVGEPDKDFPDPDLGRLHLKKLLADRACLIVLDDVWDRKALEAFDVLGPRGRLLFTTREHGLAESFPSEASVHRVGYLSSEQARALLADYAGLGTEALPPEADGVLRRCGGLPLAIAMAGAMVRGHPKRWPGLLRKFEKARIDQIAGWLPNYDHPSLLVALDVGVEDLNTVGRARGLSNARDRYVELAVFAGRGPIPEPAMAALWRSTDVEPYEARDYADLFVGRSLATWDQAEERLSLHDLQMDYVASRSRERLPTLHGRLVDGYARLCPDGWASGPDDGYFFENLPHHLDRADRAEELRELLSDATWLRAKLAATGSASLVADYALVPEDPGLRLVGEALWMSGQALAQDPGQLESQLLGRLMDLDDPAIQHLIDGAVRSRAGTWLRPLTRGLGRPGGLRRRVLRLPSPRIVVGGKQGVALSADGRTAVCESFFPIGGGSKVDPRVLVWDLRSMEGPRELPPGPTAYPAVTADGQIAVFAAHGYGLRLVDLYSSVVIDSARTELDPRCVAIAEGVDNTLRVIVGHSEGWVTCWEPGGETYHAVQAFPSGIEPVKSVNISADGSTAVAMSRSGHLVCLPLPDMRPAQAVGFHRGANDMALSPDGRLVVTGGFDRTLITWNLEGKRDESGWREQVLPTQGAPIRHVSVADGCRAVAGLEGGTIQLWDLTRDRLLASAELDETIRELAVSRDGRTALALVSKDRALVLDLAALEAETLAAQRESPMAVAVTPDGRAAFAGSTSGVISRFDVPSEPDKDELRSRVVAAYTHEGWPSKGSRLSFSGDWVGSVAVLDVTKQPPREYDFGWKTDVTKLAVTPDGRRLAWASGDSRLTVWEGSIRPPITASWRGGGRITSVGVSKAGPIFASTRNGGVFYGDPERGEWGHWREPEMEHDVVLTAATLDQRYRVLGTREGKLIWQVRGEGCFEVPAHVDGVEAVAVARTPDSPIVVTGDRNGSVGVFQFSSFQPSTCDIKILVAGGGVPVTMLALSPDGKFAVSGSAADELKLWALPELTRLASFHCDGEIKDIAVAAGGRLVAVADGAGGLHLLSTMTGPAAR